MNYLMLVCGENAPIPADAEPEKAPDIDTWVEMCGAKRIYGYQLDEPAHAKTVRVRNGETLVSDGPYVESKEYIAGFDLLECEDLDDAVAVAASHPIAYHRLAELRPFLPQFSFGDAGERLTTSETGPGERFMLMICADGIPEADEVEARLMAESQAWGDELTAAGTMVLGDALQGVETATTVRVRAGQTLLSDGPFVETKEFLAGFCVVRCADIDEAIGHAARHPLAAWHKVEVRPFWTD